MKKRISIGINWLKRIAFSFMHGVLMAVFLMPHGMGLPSVYAAGPMTEESRQPNPEHRQQALRSFYDAVERFRDEIPQEGFNPVAVVRKVGVHPGDLRKWVEENTTWVPYAGHLRSPSATIMDGTGNSLDRAMLLAELLRIAGHKPRLALAKVNTEWIEEHLAGQFREKADVREAVSPGEFDPPDTIEDPEVRALLNRVMSRRQWELEQLAARIVTQTPVIRRWFEEIREGKESSSAPQIAAHWWVVLETDGKETVQLDPSGAPEIPAEETTRPSELSERAYQVVDVAVKIEQWREGKLEEKTALSHTFRAGEHGNDTIQVGITGVGVEFKLTDYMDEPEAALREITDTVAKTTDWLPYLKVGGDVVTDYGFDDSGELHRDHRDSMQGKTMKRAAGALGALGGSDAMEADTSVLTSVCVEFQWSSQNGGRRREIRRLYDLLPPKLRLAAQAPVKKPSMDEEERIRRGGALMERMDVFVQTGMLTRPFLMARNADHLLRDRNAVLGGIHYSRQGQPDKMQTSFEKASRFPEEGYRFAFFRFILNPDQTRQYISEPNLVAHHVQMDLSKTKASVMRTGYDIISNDVIGTPNHPDPASARLEQGVIDAAAESVLMEGRDGRVISTSSLMTRLQVGNWRKITSKSELEALGDGLSPQTRALLHRGLDRGDVLIVPENIVDLKPSEAGWWELSPNTGALIGRMGVNDWGVSATQQVIMEVLIAGVGLMSLMFSAYMCADDPNGWCIACYFVSSAILLAGMTLSGPAAAAARAAIKFQVDVACLATSML
jgi:hypothetical protein